jgi:cytochrome c-type biogenesis protein CcmE
LVLSAYDDENFITEMVEAGAAGYLLKREATEAIVEGNIQPDGTFKADSLLLKCPSRYEEAPDANQYQSLDSQ